MNLTDKQKRFCEEYVVDLNATQAAIRAGYSEKTAYSIGDENLRKPEIQNLIQELQKNISEDTSVTAKYLVDNLKEILERCMQRAPVMTRAGKEWEQAKDEEGNHIWRFDANGATKAIDLLGKHTGFYEIDNKQKTDIKVSPVINLLPKSGN